MGKVSGKKGVQQLVEAFIHHGVHHIVFSPGSRNAPLVASFESNEKFKCYVIADERSAAFYALGMAEQTQKPVAIMCTSGSALLNYYPAISEAFYRNIPLIVVSADRPSEWIDQGDGQTIRQDNVFRNHVSGFATLIEHPVSQDDFWFNSRKIDELIIQAITLGQGPIHFNFPFNEPLYNLRASSIDEKSLNSKYIELLDLEVGLSKVQSEKLQTIWSSSKKKMILCGQLPRNAYLNEQLKQIAQDKSVVIVVENTSNLQDKSFVHCIDRTITSFLEDAPELYQPDLLITIGGAIVSKKIKSYLRENKPKHHWKVGKHFPVVDTYQALTTSIPMNVNSFFDVLLEQDISIGTSRFGEQWKQLDYLAEIQHQDFLEEVPYSDLAVFNYLLDVVPDQSNLHLGNSSVIRYAQLFNPIKSISYFSNRGTSGIDGSTSTAIGIAIAGGVEKVNTLIVGDMSFFYDINAFWNHYLPTNFRVFLINNGGGGIFDIIPGPSQTIQLDEYFVMRHSFSAKSMCEAYNVNYFKAHSIEEIDQQIDVFYDVLPNNRPAVMEIFTDSKLSSKVLSDYFKNIKVEDVPVLSV